jgi:formyltetrahydrofolate deformylase
VKKCILVACCPDKPGVLRAIADFFYRLGGNVIGCAQFVDPQNQRLFTRWEVSGVDAQVALPPIDEVKRQFAEVAQACGMNWEIHDSSEKPRILVAVSHIGHCLNDLLFRQEEGRLAGDIVGVISNHDTFRKKVEWQGLPFYYLPVTPQTKPQQEQQIRDIMVDLRIDLLVLARYMQILSDEMCDYLKGRAINIHHSFLPGFKGAKPYHQAYERGVKITGATAHYVTTDLDEGPIIEQDVQRVEHSYDSRQLVELGKNVELAVMGRAVGWHCERRILLDGNKTIIFK